jgi:hypothetical protein
MGGINEARMTSAMLEMVIRRRSKAELSDLRIPSPAIRVDELIPLQQESAYYAIR